MKEYLMDLIAVVLMLYVIIYFPRTAIMMSLFILVIFLGNNNEGRR